MDNALQRCDKGASSGSQAVVNSELTLSYVTKNEVSINDGEDPQITPTKRFMSANDAFRCSNNSAFTAETASIGVAK